jgi:hypothetical protein
MVRKNQIREENTMNFKSLILTFAASALLSACGSSGGGAAPSNILAPGTYKLTFSAISTAKLAVPIRGIDISVKFPAGLSVSTVTGGSGQIADTSLTPGNATSASFYALGNYSASTRTAYLSMATSQGTYRGGQFMTLLFTVGQGTAVTADDIYALNALYPEYKVVGVDTVTNSSVILNSDVKTTLGVE